MRVVVPDPPLARDGIVLRLPGDGDAGWITDACNDPITRRFVVNLPSPYTEVEARTFLANVVARWAAGTDALFVVAAEESGDPLGIVELHVGIRDPGVASIGYWLRPRARGKGAATVAVKLVAQWALGELGVERLELTTAPDNVGSQGVAERAGFTREGLLRALMATKDGGRRDSVMFSLLRGEIPA